jgi:hypothetical protein
VAARKHERFDTDVPIRLDQGEGLMRNVSASGVYFLTDVELNPGDALGFTIDFPGKTGLVWARCEVRVVRVEPQGAVNGVGAEFDTIELQRRS